MNSNLDARFSFENAKQLLAAAFPNIPANQITKSFRLTQSTYRFEQPLVAGNTLYTFQILANQQVFSNTEQRLIQQDSAIISSLGVFVALPSSATDASYLLHSYPNPFVFGADAVPLGALYNGNLSIAVNNDILVPNWDIFKHLSIPQTQQTAAAASGFPIDQIDGGSSAFYPMEPNILLIGSKNNVININIPVGITSVAANSRIVIIARGINAQNSTSVN